MPRWEAGGEFVGTSRIVAIGPYMGPFLSRSDIVGFRIKDVLQTPYEFEPQDESLPFGYRHCRVFVLLENGAFFELFLENAPGDPIPQLSADLKGLIPAEHLTLLPDSDSRFRQATIGQQVEEVVSNSAWVSFGLLLQSGQFLCRIGTQFHIGADLARISGFDQTCDFLTYWGGQPLPQFALLQAQSKP